MDLLARILTYLRCTGMAATRFGRLVLNDPRFVGDLLRGREPRMTTVRRVHAWLDGQGAAR
jgi:hypothetical protein